MSPLTDNSAAHTEIHVLALRVSDSLDTPLHLIKRDGKLTHALMHVRQQIIREVHSVGRYKRQIIADFFGLSICTVTASLTEDQKCKPRPYTAEEDALIASMHQKGKSIPQILKHISSRSASSIRRRLAYLKKGDPSISRDHKPTYGGSAPPLMLEFARRENARMRTNL